MEVPKIETLDFAHPIPVFPRNRPYFSARRIRERSENFYDEEKEVIIDLLNKNIDIVENRIPIASRGKKTEVFEHICRELAQKCPRRPRRTVGQVRKWWKRAKLRQRRLARQANMDLEQARQQGIQIITATPYDERIRTLIFNKPNNADPLNRPEESIDLEDFDDVQVIEDKDDTTPTQTDVAGLSECNAAVSSSNLRRNQEASNSMPHITSCESMNATGLRQQYSAASLNLANHPSTPAFRATPMESPLRFQTSRNSFDQEMALSKHRREMDILSLQERQMRSEHQAKMDLFEMKKEYYRRLLLSKVV